MNRREANKRRAARTPLALLHFIRLTLVDWQQLKLQPQLTTKLSQTRLRRVLASKLSLALEPAVLSNSLEGEPEHLAGPYTKG